MEDIGLRTGMTAEEVTDPVLKARRASVTMDILKSEKSIEEHTELLERFKLIRWRRGIPKITWLEKVFRRAWERLPEFREMLEHEKETI